MSSFLIDIVHMPAPFNVFALAVIFGCAASIVKTVVKEVRRYASHRHEVDLKRELLDRGLGVEEIERVVQATNGLSNGKWSKRHTRVHAGGTS